MPFTGHFGWKLAHSPCLEDGQEWDCFVHASKGQTQSRGSKCAQSVVVDYPDSWCGILLQFINLSINTYF